MNRVGQLIKRHRVGLFLLAAAALAVFGLWPRPPKEPSYQGRSLHEWLRDMNGRISDDPATNAVYQIGTNALPTLVDALTYKESFATPILLWVQKFMPVDMNIRTEWEEHQLAVHGIWVLGPQAECTVGILTNLLHDPDRQTDAELCLGRIGPKADPAVPTLLTLLSNTNSLNRGYAAACLGRIGSRPMLIVPALLAYLTKSIQQKDSSGTTCALKGLGELKSKALVAEKPIENLKTNSDSSVRYFAFEALKKINPANTNTFEDFVVQLK